MRQRAQHPSLVLAPQTQDDEPSGLGRRISSDISEASIEGDKDPPLGTRGLDQGFIGGSTEAFLKDCGNRMPSLD